MSKAFEVIFFTILSVASINLSASYEPRLMCGEIEPLSCKLEFRIQFERALRFQLLDLIRKLTSQSREYVQEKLKDLPPSDSERRAQLEKLAAFYLQSMQEAVNHQNDTRKLFRTISSSDHYKEYNLSKLLGDETAAEFDKKNFHELEKFTGAVGNIWVKLYVDLRDIDKEHFPAYDRINGEVKTMLEREGLIRIEMFRTILQEIFYLLNIAGDK